jgi:Ca-activated chloride channel family protein
MSRRRNPGSARRQATRQNAAIPAVVVGFLLVCCLGSLVVWLVNRQSSSQGAQTSDTDQRNAAVTIAYSPEKATLMKELAGKFNAEKLRTPDGQPMRLDLVEMTPEDMVTQALAGGSSFQALTPDSSLWLDQLNRQWAETQAPAEPGTIQPTLAGEPVRYAVTPIVIAAWEDAARSLGWPEQPVGWTTLQTRAQQDKNFRWSHPSTSYASGLLATLAEFYAGAGVQRGLTPELAQDPKTLQFVGDVEKTVKYYGEGELAAIQRAVKEGPASLDAFVVSEQLLTAFNTGAFGKPPAKLVALYPAEGTLWADHPLALLETADVTPNQRRTFQAFREFLATPEVQKSVLQAGYRPADLSIPLDGPDSPLTAANGVNPAEPQTTLQLPSPDVVSVVRNAWAFTKRKTNVFLVADTSGSMEGDKLSNAQTALRAFLAQILSDQERVGLVEFNSDVVNVIELDTLANNRTRLASAVDSLEAGGNTALLDAVRTAYVRLQREADPERINAIVVMTDGKENASAISLRELTNEISRGNRDLPIVIFAVAYGRDADYAVLQALADASGGQVREGTPETIRDLYKILSTYF